MSLLCAAVRMERGAWSETGCSHPGRAPIGSLQRNMGQAGSPETRPLVCTIWVTLHPWRRFMNAQHLDDEQLHLQAVRMVLLL